MSPLESRGRRVQKQTEVAAIRPLHGQMMDLTTPNSFILNPNPENPSEDTVTVNNYLGPFKRLKGAQINADPHCQRNDIEWKEE